MCMTQDSNQCNDSRTVPNDLNINSGRKKAMHCKLCIHSNNAFFFMKRSLPLAGLEQPHELCMFV